MTWFSGLLSALGGILLWAAIFVLSGVAIVGGCIWWGIRDERKYRKLRGD